MLRYAILVLVAAAVVVGSLDSSLAQEAGSNLTLEERVASLEQNLTVMQRQLDVALARSAHLFTEVEDLQHLMDLLEANNSRLSKFALPSPPAFFKVERIRKTNDGSYSVSLRWRNNALHEEVTQFVIWHAPQGEKYVVDMKLNQTGKRIQRAVVSGFKEGDAIVFKIFAKNDAGQGEPTYVEAIIEGYAPYLLRKLVIAAGIVLIVVLGFLLAMKAGKARPSG